MSRHEELSTLSNPWNTAWAFLLCFLALVSGALANGYSTYYVDAANGDDANDGGSWEQAKQTIQNAVDNIDGIPGRLVLVTNGVYDLGGAVTPGYALTNRVMINKPITVRSVNGPAATIIKGAAGSNGGNDSDAIRGVYMANGATLSGFTITNGFTRTSGIELFDECGGGLWITTDCVASNLVIGGCAADVNGGGAVVYLGGRLLNSTVIGSDAGYLGGGVYLREGGTVGGCRIEGCEALLGGGANIEGNGGQINNSIVNGNSAQQYGGGVMLGNGNEVNNCLITSNAATLSGGGVFLNRGGTLNNCTVSDNAANDGGGVYLDQFMGLSAFLNNSIVFGNTAAISWNDIYSIGENYIRYTCASDGIINGVNGCIIGDPLLNADFTLQVASPCYNAGDNAYAPTNATPVDLAGNPRIAWSVVDMGAYELSFMVSPSSGPYAGGNAVTLTNGNTLDTTTNVLVGGAVATILESGPNGFAIAMPAATNAGAVDIIVQTSDNGDITLPNAYTYNPAGAITGVLPATGSWTGGYEVVIGGTDLGNGEDVTNATICGVAADAIVSQSSTQVVVVAGAALAAGTGDVMVYSTSYGQTVASNAFEYVRENQAALVFAPASPQTENATNALSVAGGSGTGAVSYAVASGPGQIVDGTNLAATAGTGTITVVATKAQDDLYFAASATATVSAVYSAEINLLDLRQIYDGLAKAASATTMPAGLTVQFTYNGSPTAPTATGTYEVVGTVNDGEYLATATGTLQILSSWDYQHVTFSNGWCWVDWFGFYVPMGDWTWVGQRGYGWLWHEKHGFIYLPDGQLLGETWLFADDMGWLWSGDGIYPFLYREEDEAWLWYDGGTNPRRFFNFATEQWESLQP